MYLPFQCPVFPESCVSALASVSCFLIWLPCHSFSRMVFISTPVQFQRCTLSLVYTYITGIYLKQGYRKLEKESSDGSFQIKKSGEIPS